LRDPTQRNAGHSFQVDNGVETKILPAPATAEGSAMMVLALPRPPVAMHSVELGRELGQLRTRHRIVDLVDVAAVGGLPLPSKGRLQRNDAVGSCLAA
jgi:hypothetical protein